MSSSEKIFQKLMKKDELTYNDWITFWEECIDTDFVFCSDSDSVSDSVSDLDRESVEFIDRSVREEELQRKDAGERVLYEEYLIRSLMEEEEEEGEELVRKYLNESYLYEEDFCEQVYIEAYDDKYDVY